jgi:hypothetical protein
MQDEPEGGNRKLVIGNQHEGSGRTEPGGKQATCASSPLVWSQRRVSHEVTQWQVAGATERISEAWLKPVLEAILKQFPFRIPGFHSDNGSEFINQTVAAC